MNNSKLFVPRSHTIDQQNSMNATNIPQSKSKRKPKLMSRNKIMQKLFPNFHTIDQEKSVDYTKNEIYTFRKEEKPLGQEQMFSELLTKQREKYEALFAKYNITERPNRVEVKQFLGKNKKGSSWTHRL